MSTGKKRTANLMNKQMNSRKVQQQFKEYMVKHTRFDKQEVESLCDMFAHITKPKKGSGQAKETNEVPKIERSQFRDVLQNSFEMTEDIIMDRVFKAFDMDNDGRICQEEWLRGMSVFLRGDLEEQIQFAFVVFDLNADTYISKDEMFNLLKSCLTFQKMEEESDEGVKDLVDVIMKKLDVDGDMRVSLADFSTAVRGDSLLLESLGKCFPEECKIVQFQQKLREDCD